ncbi:MAG TPA: 4,5-DOPA dioxygenase extradiol [Saprospiraceae bacterium]|nr:4,5-DOPA dioxygenase extradiol [Saprospiraceae bacterium]
MAATPLAAAAALKISEFATAAATFGGTERMPLIFVGHGHPMNALFDNAFTQALGKIGAGIQRPNAIMVVSAHWHTRGTYVSLNPKPKTIYDFGPFDERLFQIRYEPEGHPDLACDVISAAPDYQIKEDPNMGLDHGAWTVLRHIYPKADIPTFQMSIDYSRPPAYHYQLASALRKMRDKGVLVLSSGNIVHNLGILDWENIDAKPFDWALEFDALVKKHLDDRDFAALVNYPQFGKLAQMAIPTNDHYLPMLYTLGLAHPGEQLRYLYEGMQYGSISMRCFQIA